MKILIVLGLCVCYAAGQFKNHATLVPGTYVITSTYEARMNKVDVAISANEAGESRLFGRTTLEPYKETETQKWKVDKEMTFSINNPSQIYHFSTLGPNQFNNMQYEHPQAFPVYHKLILIQLSDGSYMINSHIAEDKVNDKCVTNNQLGKEVLFETCDLNDRNQHWVFTKQP